ALVAGFFMRMADPGSAVCRLRGLGTAFLLHFSHPRTSTYISSLRCPIGTIKERVLAMFRPKNITCDVWGRSAVPAHFEIIANPKRPSEIVDLILWIDCPHCGPGKQAAPNFAVEESTTDTVEDIPAAGGKDTGKKLPRST